MPSGATFHYEIAASDYLLLRYLFQLGNSLSQFVDKALLRLVLMRHGGIPLLSQCHVEANRVIIADFAVH